MSTGFESKNVDFGRLQTVGGTVFEKHGDFKPVQTVGL